MSDLSRIFSDLDRCEHGRHEADSCYGCGVQSMGNRNLSQVIGYQYNGKPWLVADLLAADTQ